MFNMKTIGCFLVLILTTTNAHAYIDPGSGSALMSIIIGFFVAIGVLIKTFWYKITGILGFGKKKDSTKSDTDQ